MGSNPVGASEFFLGFICNCLSYFTTAKISFSVINWSLDSLCQIKACKNLKLNWKKDHLGIGTVSDNHLKLN